VDVIIEHAPAEIAASLLGALVAWFLVVLVSRLNDYRLRRRYPLRGHYLTQYEDVEGEATVVRKAGVEFSQRGMQLSGIVTNLDDGRSWRTRLTIDAAGFLQGLYWAELPGDPGTGVVFLQREPDDSLVGIWAGYDSRNLRVEGGKWTFRRQAMFDVKRLQSEGRESDIALEILRTELDRGWAIQGVLEPLGFMAVGDLDRFWQDESRQQGYECPDCGNPCTCAARVLVSA